MAYSYMLEPHDPKERDLIYHYRLLLDVLETPARAKAFFKKKKSKQTVRIFRKVLRDKTLKARIRKRKKKAKRVGELIRFLNAMKLLNVEEPSINKAFYLSKKGFCEREKERGLRGVNSLAYSSTIYKKEMKHFNSVLHLCAAYSMVDPDRKKVEGSRTQKIQGFFAKSKKYLEFVRSFNYARQADEKNAEQISYLLKETPYAFPESFACEDTTIEIESAKFLAKVEKLLPGFTHDWEDKVL